MKEKKISGTGLRGQVAGQTSLCTVGKTGSGLTYRGHDISTLSEKASFEEVAYLLLRGELPNQEQLNGFVNKIVSLRESGDNFIGKAKILGTPMGKIAANLVEEGVKLGVSSRGIGSLKMTREGCNVVGDDFMLATAADIVADPSAPDAFVEGIMEGKDWVWDGSILREKYATKTYKTITTLVEQKTLDEQKLSLFNEFLSNL